MPQRSHKELVLDRASELLAQYAKARRSLRPPIIPEDMADLCAVVSIEYRHMIPEGVLEPVADGFKIHLQNNFSDKPGVKSRNRFTLAHELVHTFFYERNGKMPTPMKGFPEGERLERLCHIGATQILVPDVLLKSEIELHGKVASSETIFKLAKLFAVSLEVMMRRLHELELVADDKFAAILVDTAGSDKRLIRAACYGPWLLPNAVAPKRGHDFDSWVRQLQPSSAKPQDSAWTHVAQTAKISATKIVRSNRSFVLELKLSPLES